MAKVNGVEDCGNAPRKGLLRNLYVAYADGDLQHILDHLSEKVVWHTAGGVSCNGLDACRSRLEEKIISPPLEIYIDNIITHGNTAAVNGTMTFAKEKIDFCDVYLFAGFAKTAKIKSIKSYAIKLSDL